MKILHIGASGTIGKKVFAELSKRHTTIAVGSKSGDIQVNMEDPASIAQMFAESGTVDAVIVTAGHAWFGPFGEMGEEHFYQGIKSKLMGQINITMQARKHITEGGSVTLTTGILAEDPVPGSTGLAFVNGALHSFVLAASKEMLAENIRLNVVAPGLVEDAAEKYDGYFPGHVPVTMDRMVAGYIKAVEGNGTGEIIRIY